tara:strand:+ start:6150 stop:6632 length:483 start_codon:yes stop_codon:yes gene_type:complete
MGCLWDLLPDDAEARIWLFEKARRIQEFGVDNATVDNTWQQELKHKKRYVSLMYCRLAAFCGVDSFSSYDVDVWEYSRTHSRVMTRFEAPHPIFVPPCASWGMRTNEFRSPCDVLALEVSHDQVRRAALQAPRDHYDSQWWVSLPAAERRRIRLIYSGRA